MYYRRPHKPPSPPKPPERPPAIAGLMRAEFEEKEYGVVGEFIVGSSEPAPPPVPQPPMIPPPPWAVNYDPALDPDREPAVKPEPDEEDKR
jgi:hypothetical protein